VRAVEAHEHAIAYLDVLIAIKKRHVGEEELEHRCQASVRGRHEPEVD
jgi:hypothetical protein